MNISIRIFSQRDGQNFLHLSSDEIKYPIQITAKSEGVNHDDAEDELLYTSATKVFDTHGSVCEPPDIFDRGNTLLANNWVLIGKTEVYANGKKVTQGRKYKV